MADIHNVLRGHKAAISNPNVSEEAKLHSQREIERIETELGLSPTLSTVGLDSHVLGGYKAAINNPNVSDKAKDNAQQVLDNAGIDTSATRVSTRNDRTLEQDVQLGDEHQNRVLGGYKATLQNPNVSEEAREHARQVLDGEASVLSGRRGSESHEHHVLGGYKATLHNPNTSEEAKEHARQILENVGEPAV